MKNLNNITNEGLVTNEEMSRNCNNRNRQYHSKIRLNYKRKDLKYKF